MRKVQFALSFCRCQIYVKFKIASRVKASLVTEQRRWHLPCALLCFPIATRIARHTVLDVSFSDFESLTGIYRIGGLVPISSPPARIPRLLAFFHGFLQGTWLSKDRNTDFVRRSESQASVGQYHIMLIHAEDDIDVFTLRLFIGMRSRPRVP